MKLVLIGDSLFARKEGKEKPHIEWSMEQLDDQLVFQNLAVSGANSVDTCQILKEADVSGADFVFVWIGANDMATHKQIYLGEYQDNLKWICERLLKNYAPSQIVLLGMTFVDEEKQPYRTNRLAGYYSEIVEKMATEYGMSYLAVQPLFQNGPAPADQLLKGSMDDGLHFGEVAYNILAKAMYQAMQ
ncbi:GDSL-type esterase/lipase family protein [Streptococcus cameli]